MKARRIKHRIAPALDLLERRDVPATWGLPWPDAQHLTASFVPDGTSVEGSSSVLYQKLDAQLGAGNWEKTILSAIGAWASNANVNIGVVGDSGAPIGVAGPAQGDVRIGDIRISAAPLSPSVLAITSPYDPSTGTNSGDMVFNSNANFQPGTANSYDLYTVALHEAGHIFGFADNSTDPTNFMYNGYKGPVTGLQPSAITALQASYGAPTAGAAEQPTATLKLSSATALNTPTSRTGTLTSGIGLAADSAVFKYTTIPNTDYGPGIDFVVRNAGLGLLTPKLTVYSASGAVLGTASAPGPLAGGVAVHIGNVANVSSGSQGVVYYLSVTGTASPFSQGAFQVVGTPTNIHASNTVNTTAAVPLPQQSNSGANQVLAIGANINAATQCDVYSFVAPTVASHSFKIRLATAGTGLSASSFQLYDSTGKVVSQVSSAPLGETDLAVSSYTPGAKYYVQVISGGQSLGTSFGNYRLVVDFAGTTTSSSALTDPSIPFVAGGAGASSATPLTPITPNSTTNYRNLSRLDSSSSQAVFQITTPSSLPNRVMFATVMGMDNAGFAPQLSVTDASGASVTSSIICAEGGMMVIQIPQANSNTKYLLTVTGGAPGAAVSTGNIFLDVTFSSTAAATTKLLSGGLSQASSSGSTSFTLASDQVYRFNLTAGNGPVGSGLTMQVFDSGGHVVATLSTAVNQTASLTTRLALGTYTVKVVPTYGAAVGNISYSLTGVYFTDPIRVYSTSTTTTTKPTM